MVSSRARRTIAMGVILGSLLAFSPGFVFVIALVVATAYGLHARTGVMERKFLVWLFVVGFLVRAVTSLGLDAAAWVATKGSAWRLENIPGSGVLVVVDQTRTFIGAGDSDYYSVRGFALARYVAGARDTDALAAIYKEYGYHSYLHVIALFYSMFGYSPVAVKLLNCFWGALIGPALYALVKVCFAVPVARWSSLAVTCVPSLILWSATNLKDIGLILLGLVVLRALLLLTSRTWTWRRLPFLMVLAAALLIHAEMRARIFTFSAVICFIGALWWTRRSGLVWRVLAVSCVLAALVLGSWHVQQGIVEALDVHIGHAKSLGASYRFLPSHFYDVPKEEWAALVKLDGRFLLHLGYGVVQYLVQPLAGNIRSAFQLLAYPQMVAWYVVLCLAAWGVASSLATRQFGPLFLVLVTAAWTGVGALTNGNAGTAFRMRDMVTPLFVAFAAEGVWRLMRSASCTSPGPQAGAAA